MGYWYRWVWSGQGGDASGRKLGYGTKLWMQLKFSSPCENLILIDLTPTTLSLPGTLSQLPCKSHKTPVPNPDTFLN